MRFSVMRRERFAARRPDGRRWVLSAVALAVAWGLIPMPQLAVGQTPQEKAGKHVVFLAGGPSHGFGSHEHRAGCLLLAKKLGEALPEVTTAVYSPWPADSAALARADAVVVFADGGGGNLIQRHLAELQPILDRPVGLVVLHYALDLPDPAAREKMKQWIGGYYETFWSVNPHWRAEFREMPDHPVTRGVRPFSIDDEWYYHMRFVDETGGLTPILTAVPPDATRKGPDGPHSGNPAVRARLGMPEHVAWAYERPGGGRGFGFTGGHWHWNWAHDDYRTLVLNAVAWAAGIETPTTGLRTSAPTVDELLENLDEPIPDSFDRETLKRRIQAWRHP